MKKIIILSFFLFAFIFVGVKTNAKVYSVEFTPKGYNYIDPYNFYYLPINKDVHGYVNSIREFNVSNVDEFVLKVKNPDNIEIIFLEYTVYNVQHTAMETIAVEVDDPTEIYFEYYDEDMYYMSLSMEVMLCGENCKLYDMNNYFLADSLNELDDLNTEDYLYQGPDFKELTLLEDEITLETNISDPISFEMIKNNLYVYDINDENISEKKELITNTYGTSDYQIGEWVIEYSVTNSVDLTTYLKINVKVLDDIFPVIEGITELTMKNVEPVTVSEIQSQLSATDNHDGDITDKIEILEDELTNREEELGTFFVKFGVSDEAGNLTEHIVTVEVVQGDKTKPVISGTFEHTVYTDNPKDEEYFLSFITVTDDYTLDIQDRIQVISNSYQYNTDKIGNYQIIIKVVDNAKNYTIGYINIKVLDTSYPVFVLDAIDVTIPLKSNMQNISGIISYLQKTNYLNNNEVSIISDNYSENKNALGSYIITLEQDDKLLNVRINVEDEIIYQNKIPSLVTIKQNTFLNVIYKKCVKVRDFFKEFFSELFS